MVLMKHEDLGGVTDSRTRMSQLILGDSRAAEPVLRSLAPRDASTILDVKGNWVVFENAPKLVAIEPLAVCNLGTSEDIPYYHGGGLLPAGINRSTRVLTPSIYARPGKWGRRNVTSEEVLKAKDFSLVDIARLESFQLTNDFYEALIPGKCLTEGVKALMNGGIGEYWNK